MTVAAIIFVVFLLIVAAVTFFVLRKAIKMAVRAAIVGLIVIIALVGGASLWMLGSDSAPQKTPATKKSR